MVQAVKVGKRNSKLDKETPQPTDMTEQFLPQWTLYETKNSFTITPLTPLINPNEVDKD